MSFPAPFLGGANERLLPVSIPFRFFFGALVFQAAGWLVLLLGARDLAAFVGGTGPVLAAIHLLTLGVLTMSAMGASYQFLPVVTRRALLRLWPARLSFWLFVPGVVFLATGMAGFSGFGLELGAGLVSAALLLFAALTAENLRRAASVPVVAAHGWAGLVALLGLVIAGFLLVADLRTGMLEARQSVVSAHLVLAVFGFMGLFAAGFSHVLVPMFALSNLPLSRAGWGQLILALGAIASFLAGAALNEWLLLSAAATLGLAAAFVYLWTMFRNLRAGMRKRLGLSFLLIKISWFFLVAGLLLGGAILLDISVTNRTALFGFVILAGWLLTFLMGILQRIIPFLASMHISDQGGKPPLLSELTPNVPLIIHAICHFSALALILAGIFFDLTALIQLGAGFGLVASGAFAAFIGHILIKLRG